MVDLEVVVDIGTAVKNIESRLLISFLTLIFSIMQVSLTPIGPTFGHFSGSHLAVQISSIGFEVRRPSFLASAVLIITMMVSKVNFAPVTAPHIVIVSVLELTIVSATF